MLGRGETSKAFFTHSARPSFYTLRQFGREWCVAASKTVQCYCAMYKCGDKDVKSSKQMYMSLHFNSQRIVQDSIMSAKGIINITHKCV